jgi:hypothetical protein
MRELCMDTIYCFMNGADYREDAGRTNKKGGACAPPSVTGQSELRSINIGLASGKPFFCVENVKFSIVIHHFRIANTGSEIGLNC